MTEPEAQDGAPGDAGGAHDIDHAIERMLEQWVATREAEIAILRDLLRAQRAARTVAPPAAVSPATAAPTTPADATHAATHAATHGEHLLILGTPAAWIGLPWAEVAAVDLADGSLAPERSSDVLQISLHGLVSAELGRVTATLTDEPFLVTVGRPARLYLTCTQIGGLCHVEDAVERQIEAIVLTEGRGLTQPVLEPVLRYARSRRATIPPATNAGGPARHPDAPVAETLEPPRDAGNGNHPDLIDSRLAPPVSAATDFAETTDADGEPGAYVAVGYLPARVALVRHLRQAGWRLEEDPCLDLGLPSRIQAALERQGRLVLFVEDTHRMPDSVASGLAALVRSDPSSPDRSPGRNCRLIAVASRYQLGDGPRPWGEVTRLAFPFSEPEIISLLAETVGA